METRKLVDLLKIGLTEGEAKAYAGLLKIGPSSVGKIRKETKVSHSNIYEILERLIDKGIVTIIIKNNIKVFQAVDPDNLSNYLDKKDEEVKKQRKLLEKAIPRIRALQESYPKQEAMMFVGLKGLRTAYKEFFKGATKDDENLWIYVHDEEIAEKSNRFYTHNMNKIFSDIKIRGIGNVEYKNTKFMKLWSKKYDSRFVDFPLFSHGEVFKDRFLVISWEEPVTAVIIHASHVSNNFRKYFESIWKIAKP